MLQVGDTVKVIDNKDRNITLHPIGTIGKITEIEYEDDIPYYCVIDENNSWNDGWWYKREQLEQGHLEWVKEEGN